MSGGRKKEIEVENTLFSDECESCSCSPPLANTQPNICSYLECERVRGRYGLREGYIDLPEPKVLTSTNRTGRRAWRGVVLCGEAWRVVRKDERNAFIVRSEGKESVASAKKRGRCMELGHWSE